MPVFAFSGVAANESPSTGRYGDGRTPRAPARMTHRVVASDVTLQMFLANRVWFSACWWIATVVSTLVKTNGAYEDFDDIRPVMLAVWSVFEPCRLYVGYAGNLREKVPLVWGFVALSAAVSLPISLYFRFGQKQVQPFDKALHTVSILLIVFECVAGVRGARKVLTQQNLAFFDGER